MFIELDESLAPYAAASSPQIRQWIEDLLDGHFRGNFILVSDVRTLMEIESLGLSPRGHATIKSIRRKIHDYQAALKSCSRSLIATHPSTEPNYRFMPDGKVRVSMRLLTPEIMANRAIILAEHLRDATLLGFICETFLGQQGYPPRFVNYRTMLGGGSCMPEVLRHLEPMPLKAILLCDRDCLDDVPPFRAGTTGSATHKEAVALGLICGDLGMSTTNPMFAMITSWGRAVESLVGPNLFNLYLEVNGRSAERCAFVSVFDGFPELGEEGVLLWKMINLKDGTSTNEVPYIAGKIQACLGSITPALALKLSLIDTLYMPRDVITWVLVNRDGSRHSASIRRAIGKDLEFCDYRRAVEEAASFLRDIAAGDRSIVI